MSEKDYLAFIEKTSADPTQAGFDFQYLTFMYAALKMEPNSTIEYETEDDLLYIPPKEKKQLIQAKFAVLDKDKKIPNMRVRDIELWHTIHNWIKGAVTLGDGSYFTTRKFSIWTDKKFEDNSLFNMILSYQNKEIDIDILNKLLDVLIADTSDGVDTSKPNEVKVAMKKLQNLSPKDKELFYSNFSMEYFPETSIINNIKEVLEQSKFTPIEKVDEVFNSLYGEMKTDKFVESFKRNKTKLSASDFAKKYKRCFNKPFNRKLNIDRSLVKPMPENICSQTFIKQLLGIEAIFPDETNKIHEMYRKRMCTILNIDKWKKNGDLLEEEEKDLDRMAYNKWEAEFNACHRNIHNRLKKGTGSVNEEEFNSVAVQCHDELCKKDISFNDGYLDQETAIGYFYEMSDEPRIGWHYDWVKKYKVNS